MPYSIRTGKRYFLIITVLFSILLIHIFANLGHAQVLRVKNGVFKDTTNKFTPVITGGTVVGDALVFGATTGNEIKLVDNGNLNFSGGFTIKGELWFEELPTYPFVMKVSTLSTDFRSGKIISSWMCFPSEPIFVTKTSQYTYYPVGTELLNGYGTVPIKKWVKVEINYDESLGVTTTKINGVVDRYHIRYRGREKVAIVTNMPMRFLQNAKNVKVRELSFKSGQPVATPTMNVDVNGLPFKNQVQLTFDQIDKRLPLPITVTVTQIRAGQANKAFTMKLRSLNRKDTLIPMLGGWLLTPMTVKVQTSTLTKNFQITNRPAPDPYTGKFPIMVYGVKPEDFKLVAGLGFNVIQNDFTIMSAGLITSNIKRSLDSAKANNMKLLVVANSGPIKLGYVAAYKSHPALYGWYLADEPSGVAMFDTIRHDNNMVKAVDEKHPTIVMMNNFNKLTGLDCDIIGVDPSPVPNISMRMVDDAVKAGLRASNGTKPVWSIIPHYPQKMPTLAELKSMAWLGIIAGASGIGMFEFDHRSPSTPTGYYAGSNPDYLANIGTVFREVASWDWLLTAKPTMYSTGNLALHACTKTATGKTYLILGNDSRKAESGTVTVGSTTVPITMDPLEVRLVDMATL